MATLAAVRTSVKARLGINDTAFDTLLDEAISAAVKRLYPRASLEVDVQQPASFSVDDYGECEISLSGLTTAIASARRVEAFDGYTWRQITDTLHHGTKLRLRGLNKSSDTRLRIYGRNAFPAITDVPDHLLQAVYWYSMGEFYDFMAGSKADYNIYMQNTGARAVDNMREESAYYDTKADAYLDEQART